nr:Chain C, T-cell Surface Antigen Cd2 [Homo sapiens]2J7I_C Chain C, T-cell Surface Antigen Cd2 [Homo sapiens]2J7I_D Chain D, T-cell Surface Antigen Cd2 [Homo sapiens]
KGPPLPRPRV